MDRLRVFNGDKSTKQELLDYCISYFEEQIIKRAKKKENTDSLVDAVLELMNAFEQLDMDLDTKPKENANINQAR